MQKIRQHPIILLIAVNILIGLFTFHSYGVSWDEPLFYDYAEAIGYAYSPPEWFSGNFNLKNAFGSSGSDHANRGPAYLLLARQPVHLLELFGVEQAAAWHLVNFLTFQLGVYLFYLLARRWIHNPAALASTALFTWQPLLWGHAFINPKDPSFLVFFVGAMYFGLEMVDDIAQNEKFKPGKLLLAAFFLGIATSIRVLGPLAGLLVCLYAASKFSNKNMATWVKIIALYGIATVVIVFITWPYLWTNPVEKFMEAFGFMSDNPTQLKVLFGGELYRADELPRRYLPVLLGITLSEFVWPLFGIGTVLALWKLRREKWISLMLVLLWFLIPLAYVLLRQPPMYDGYRHFLFILPPIFILAGFAFEEFFLRVQNQSIRIVTIAIILASPVVNMAQLHPYQYTYYNSFIGSTSGAFRTYETDYWLTCYKEAIEEFQNLSDDPATIYVHREAYIAAIYAKDFISVKEERGALSEIQSGDYVLVNTRANEDIKTFRDAPTVLTIQRDDAVFCIIKRLP